MCVYFRHANFMVIYVTHGVRALTPMLIKIYTSIIIIDFAHSSNKSGRSLSLDLLL